jgi:hypothetical protein
MRCTVKIKGIFMLKHFLLPQKWVKAVDYLYTTIDIYLKWIAQDISVLEKSPSARASASRGREH